MTPATARNMLNELLSVSPQPEDGPATPGPWTAHLDAPAVTGRALFFPITAGGMIVGRAWESRSLRHGRANARLMAASPQLLVALELGQEALELAMTLTADATVLARLQVAYHRNRLAISDAKQEEG